jgi:type III secretion system needle length determinant
MRGPKMKITEGSKTTGAAPPGEIEPQEMRERKVSKEGDENYDALSREFSSLLENRSESPETDISSSDLAALSAFSIRPPGEAGTFVPTHEVSPFREIPPEARNIVDQILVTDPRHSGKEEVRIVLKDSFLAGTEIRISKEGDGVRITMVTDSDNSYQFLSELKEPMGNDLRTKLERDVRMDVQLTGSEHRNEGRSRQRRSVVEEWEP